MKSILLPLAGILLFANQLFAQNVGIGTNIPNASAQLDISSTSKGMLIPRMTTAQRNAIVSPSKGLMVYDTDLNSLYHYNGSGWAAVGAGGGFSLPFDGSVNLGIPGFKVTNSGAGPAIQAVTTNEFGIALQASNTTNYGYSVYAYSRSPNGIGVYAYVDSSIGIKGESGKGIGVDAISTDSTAMRARIIKGANTDPVILATHAGAGAAINASSQTGFGLLAATSTANSVGAAVYGSNNGTQGSGVFGVANFATGYAVKGESNFGTGVYGYSGNNKGVSGSTISGTALYGYGGSGYGLEVLGKVKIAGGNTSPAAGAVLTSLDASGNATWQIPVLPAPKVGFRAYGVSSTETAGTPNNSMPYNTFKKVEFQTKSYDTHGDFIITGGTPATSTKSTFTPPFRGVYHFDAAVHSTDNIAFNHYGHYMRLMLNRGGSVSTIAEVETRPETLDGSTIQISMDVFLEADDMIWVEFKQVNLSFTAITLETSGALAFFAGHLIYTQ